MEEQQVWSERGNCVAIQTVLDSELNPLQQTLFRGQETIDPD
jgi:hypothetical protein